MPQSFLAMIAGRITRVIPPAFSSGVSSAGLIPALNSSGQLDPSFVPGFEQTTMTASEAIAAGSIINVWNNGTAYQVRNADNTAVGKEAMGYAPSAIASSASGPVILGNGIISGLSGLVADTIYYLGVAGGVTVTPPCDS